MCSTKLCYKWFSSTHLNPTTSPEDQHFQQVFFHSRFLYLSNQHPEHTSIYDDSFQMRFGKGIQQLSTLQFHWNETFFRFAVRRVVHFLLNFHTCIFSKVNFFPSLWTHHSRKETFLARKFMLVRKKCSYKSKTIKFGRKNI